MENIRHYRGILAWRDIAEKQPPRPLRAGDNLPPQLSGEKLEAL